MHNEDDLTRGAAAPDSSAPPPSGFLAEISQLARAVKHLFGAQFQLLADELGLARAAISWSKQQDKKIKETKKTKI